MRFRRPQNETFSEIEDRLLEKWGTDGTFHRSVEQRREQGAGAFVFYDGPPFANGMPHYGHIMTSYIKDTVPRYFTMRGFLVERRWGWDCHGLPVELDAQHQLGLGGVKEINEYGVGAFNETCRASVFTYADEWRRVIDRIGRWVDWDHQYRTMDLSYMETVMHVFARLHDEGLIYESFKVLAYCTSCQTPLSNFETRLDDAYRDRTDPTVTVRLPFVDDPDTSLLVWTTTPWTLPSNVAAAVSPTMQYEVWQHPDDGSPLAGHKVVLAASSRGDYAPTLGITPKAMDRDDIPTWDLVDTVSGHSLEGRHYEPLFGYFTDTANAFKVVASDIVTEGEGTGIVHIAPAFGEEDAQIGRKFDISGPMPVRDDGTFDERVTDFTGRHVLDANGDIQHSLKVSGRLFASAPYEHAYPHCWRCDNPLIYRAIESWMLDIAALRGPLVDANAPINWIPGHVGPGAMRHGIESAPDWALTRNRFWGSPIPVWKCDGGECEHPGEEILAVGTDARYHADSAGRFMFVPHSTAQLEAVSGQDVTDLHRPMVDEITWPCPRCDDGTMRRVPDVLDCWFESGAMPFAQRHWPFDRTDDLDFPADFIVEYVGQVRGWFYTLIVLSTALTDRAPFENCIAHGILLGNDGRKLSKRLKNYPDPEEVIATHGSDALRISLLASPIVRGGDGAVSIDAVKEARAKFLAPLWNAYTFFATYAETAGYEGPGRPFEDLGPDHPLDRYVLAALERTRERMTTHLDAFEIAQAYDELERFLESLTNWYVRLSRRRFWEPTAPLAGEEREPFETLHAVLQAVARLAAPLLPFLADEVAERLGASRSVHLDDWPAPWKSWRDDDLVAANETVQRLVTMARGIRAEHRVPNRQPLSTLLVVGVDESLVERFRDVLESEVNVQRVEHRADARGLATERIVPNPRVLGPRLGKGMQDVLRAAKAGDWSWNDDGTASVAGETLTAEELSVSLDPATEELGITADRGVVVALDLTVTPDLELEGLARLLVRHLQNLRKTAGLEVSDRVRVAIRGGQTLSEVTDAHGDRVAEEVLADRIDIGGGLFDQTAAVRLGDEDVTISLERA